MSDQPTKDRWLFRIDECIGEIVHIEVGCDEDILAVGRECE